MPIDIRESQNGLGVIVSGRGVVTDAEYLAFYRKQLLQDHTQTREYRYSLNDWTEVTSANISLGAIEEVSGLSRRIAETNPNTIIAIVADKDVIFGLSRMWETLSDDGKLAIMVFRRRGDAEMWIRQQVQLKFGIELLTVD